MIERVVQISSKSYPEAFADRKLFLQRHIGRPATGQVQRITTCIAESTDCEKEESSDEDSSDDEKEKEDDLLNFVEDDVASLTKDDRCELMNDWLMPDSRTDKKRK